MAEYLFVSSDLASAGTFADERLADATDRHKLSIVVPPVGPAPDLVRTATHNRVAGAVLSLERGVLIRAQLSFLAAVLASGKPAWLYWPLEGVVEAVDAERLGSLRRHRWALLAHERILVPLQGVKRRWRRVPPALRWIYRGEFPIGRYDIRNELEHFIAGAVPVPFTGGTDAVQAGAGAYLRTDFWVKIESGGSYGHTSYVAKELAARSGHFVCFLPQRYRLIDGWGIQQVVLDPPIAHTTGEDPIIGATEHYHPLLKAAFLALRPAFLYERICLGNYAGALLSRELDIPYIVEYNGSEISMSRSFQQRTPFYEHEYLLAEMAAFEQASVISVISEPVRDDVVRRGIDPAKVFVNPNGADTDVYAPAPEDKAAVRADLGFCSSDCVVGFTGTFGGWHGIDVLAAALPKICAQTDARFLLIGDGSHKHLVDAAIVEHRLQDRVRSTGRVPQAEGARLLKACDIYVSPHSSHMVDSRFFGSPTKLFEYMALGGGIVASDLEQIGEVLSPALRPPDLVQGDPAVRDQRAVLCTPGNVDEFVKAVVAVVRNRPLREALGRNARAAAVQHFSWRRHVARLWDFIDERERRRPGRLSVAPDRPLTTGDAYKDEVQHQWDHNPVGSQYGGHAEPATLEWFLRIEAHRYGEYAPWMPETMEFAKHAGKDLLEVGAGMGTDLAQFAKHGARVTDVDLSAGHLALAQQNFRLRGLDGRFVHQDAETLPFGDDSFDVVYSNGVIHHTPRTDRVVGEIFRVLRPGGRAIVMVYAENSLHYWRNLILNVGLRQSELLSHSAGNLLSRHVERSDNDARPLVKVYTKAALRKLFAAFTDIQIVQRQMMPAELPERLRSYLGRIERVAGWNLIIKARKPLRA